MADAKPANKAPTKKAAEHVLKQVWDEIEEWYREHGAAALESLRDGASERQISDFEAAIGVKLPADYRASLDVHDGDATLHDYDYLSIERAENKWSMMAGLDEDGTFKDRKPKSTSNDLIQNVWWHRGWIPFASDSAGNLLCLDMVPGLRGTKGQVIRMETISGPEASGIDSFLLWLQRYRNDLDKGRYEVDEYGFLIER